MHSFSHLKNQIIFNLKLLFLSGLILTSGSSFAITITANLEAQIISGVGSSPVPVTFENTTYTNPIPVCTYNIPTRSANPATVRIQNLTTSGMSIYLQGSDGAVTAGDVHCIIAQEGAYTTAVDGIEFEARSVVSDETNGSGRWQNSRLEIVRDTNVATTDLVTGSYASAVVVGQVISSNDSAFSTFWTNNCSSRQSPPDSNNICVGKHNGKLGAGAEPSAAEMIGFMVFESQTATTAQVNNIHYAAFLGADTVRGVTNNPPYTYNLPNSYNYEFGIASQNAEDGGDGSWAVLYGADPLALGNVDLAVDETDAPNRGHIDEQVAYVAFAVSELTLEKTVITNNGGTAVDTDFILTYTGSSTASGIEGSEAVTDAFVLPGTYGLSEANLTGYSASSWSCVGGSLVGSDVTLAAGDDVTCTITNDDDPARLTISKTIITDNGVVATLADFNIAVNGVEVPWSAPTSTTGGSEVVSTSAGTYTLSEIDFASYAEGTWSCIDDDTSNPVAVTNGGAFDGADVTVLLGQSVTCSITNDDIDPFIPSLTVVKTILSDNGGINSLDDFDVSVDGSEVAWADPASMLGGSQVITQTLGTYTLSENNLGTYTEGIWDCRDQNGVNVAVTNSGIFNGADITLSTGQALICSITNDDNVPSYTMSKMAGTPSVTQGTNTTVTDKDDTVVYTFTFVNTGTVDLVNLAVQDPLFGSGNVCTIASLPAGNTDNTSCVLTYTITQADVDAGSILNTAASTAYAPDGATLILENDTANDNSVSTPITQAPSLSVIKSAATLTTDADSSTDITLGDTLTYTVTATNDGNTTLSNVVVSDPNLDPSSFTCLTVAPNASCMLSGTHMVDLNESNAGNVVNTASVVADEITSSVPSNTVTTPVVQTLEFTMTKTSDTADIGVPGIITYTFTFTNTGNVSLTELTIEDTNIDTGTLNNCPVSSLAPGETATCTATRTISREQISAGDDIINTAIPSAKAPDGITPAVEDNSENDNTTTTTVTTWADVSVTKTLLTAGPYTSGQTVTYELVVTNSASSWSDATDVVVNDLPTNLIITNVSSANCSALPCTIPLLNIGDSETITVEATAP